VSSENSQGNHHSGTSGRKLASQPLDRQGSTVQRTRPSQIVHRPARKTCRSLPPTPPLPQPHPNIGRKGSVGEGEVL